MSEVVSKYAVVGMLLIIIGVLGNTVVRGKVLKEEKVGKEE
jgi:hypothetical protein